MLVAARLPVASGCKMEQLAYLCARRHKWQGAVDWCGTGSALTLDYTGHGASGGGGFSLFLAGRSRSDFKTHKLKHPELAADLD